MLWIGAAAVIRRAFRAMDRRPAPAPDLGPDLLLGALAGIAIAQGVIAGIIPRAIAGGPEQFFAMNACLAGLGSALVVGSRRVGVGKEILGLTWPFVGRGVVCGVALYVLILPGVLGLHAWNRDLIDQPDRIQRTMQMFLDRVAEGRPAIPFAMTVVLVVVVPMFEEVLFRGWLQSGLRAVLGGVTDGPGPAVISVVLTAVVFTAIHPSFTWLPILALGLVLGALFERTRSLWPCVALHGLHNAFTLWYPVLFPPDQ